MSSFSCKPAVGQPLPELTIQRLDGEVTRLGGSTTRHTLLVVYRGRHCPRCKRYLNKLESMLPDWQAAGMDVIALSADTRERAAADIEEFSWSFPLGYDLSETDMRRLGLYITDPLSPDEAPRRFAEPGIFCLRPDGVIQLVCLSNGPAARPDLEELLDGMIFNITNDRPTRGLVQ